MTTADSSGHPGAVVGDTRCAGSNAAQPTPVTPDTG